MPTFSQEKIPTKTQKKATRKKGIAQEIIETFKTYVEQLEMNHIGKLTFSAGESIAQGRKALIEAGVQLKKHLKVRKPRGEANALEFQQITAKEFNAAKAKAKARGAKLKGVPKKTTAKKAPAKKKAGKK